jgi:hypothetical protein
MGREPVGSGEVGQPADHFLLCGCVVAPRSVNLKLPHLRVVGQFG